MRLINADLLEERKFADIEFTQTDYQQGWNDAIDTIIDNAPTIEERPKGKWIIHNDYNENCRYGCDQCGNLTNRNSSFCPDCGARMEVEE